MPQIGAAMVLALGASACGGDDDAGRPSTTSATSSTATTTTVSTSTTGAPPVFSATVTAVTTEDLYASWRPGCPLPVEQLRAVDLTHWGPDGGVHSGRLIVAADRAEQVVDIFRDLFAAQFPIERMEPIDVYDGDDLRSMEANNTSAFNCRRATGGSSWSEHAYGRAIDINPFVNPYVRGSTVLPPESAPYTDRSRDDAGMIHPGDPVVEAFASRGWIWGGDWTSFKDYQHFSPSGR